MSIFWNILLKAALPKLMDLLIEAMQESAHEHDNEIDDYDTGRMIAHKDHLEAKMKVNLSSKGGGKLFKRRLL